MLKFKILLWALTKLLQREIKNSPACAQYVKGKSLVFRIETQSGAGRHFMIGNGKVTSAAGPAAAPAFTMTFKDGPSGFAVLSAKESKDAFLSALHSKDLAIRGNFVEVMWFQGLTEFLQSSKA